MADFVLLLWGNLNNAGLSNQHLPCTEPGLVSRGYWIESQCKHLPFFSFILWYLVMGGGNGMAGVAFAIPLLWSVSNAIPHPESY